MNVVNTDPNKELDDDNKKIDNSNVSNEPSGKTDNATKDGENSETYKKRYSDSSREAKKIAQTHSAYRKVLKDNSYLLELEEDVAKNVVTQLFEDGYATTDSLEELLETLKSMKTGDEDISVDNTIDKEKLTKEIEANILARQQEEKAQGVLDKSLSKFDDEVKAEYLKEFKDTIGKRKLTPELAKKEIEKIILYNNKDEIIKGKRDNALGRLASKGLGSGNSKTTTSMTEEKLDQMGMEKSRQHVLYPELFPNLKK